MRGVWDRIQREGARILLGSEEVKKDIEAISEGDLVRAMTDGHGWKVLIKSLEEQEEALKEEMVARDLTSMNFQQIYQWIVDKRSKIFAFRALRELARKKIADGLEAQERMKEFGDVNGAYTPDK